MKRICVFCGSSAGARSDYIKATRSFSRVAVENNIGIVYGGASVGLMGALADAVLEAGGEVIGVIPRLLQDCEIAHPGLSELHIVETMHERKATMARLSDGFVSLPGGAGTLEEFFEVWTWAQLGIHQKPCGLLNVAGYYNRLRALVNHMVGERFLKPDYGSMLLIEEDPQTLLNKFASYLPPVDKWAVCVSGSSSRLSEDDDVIDSLAR